jgi:gamma-glutamylcysteine synthetase
MDHKGWYSRGCLPHFDSPETIQFVTFRLADSLPRAVAQALAVFPDGLFQTDQKLDFGLGACLVPEPAKWRWSSARFRA